MVVVLLLLLPGARFFAAVRSCPSLVVRSCPLSVVVVRELISHQSWMLRQSCASDVRSRVVRVRIESWDYVSSIVGHRHGQTNTLGR